MKKIFLIFIVLSLRIFSSDIYTPKNNEEKVYLEKIRKEKIKLGLQESELTDYKINGRSLNDIIYDLFKNYLKLDVEPVRESWLDTYVDFENGKLDAIGMITTLPERKKFAEFSRKIFTENLYLASKNIELNSKEDLKGKTIYVYKNDNSLDGLKKYLKKENIDVKIEKVDNILEYLDDHIIYISGFYVNGLGNKIPIGKTPGTAIGLSKKYEKLLPILNNALAEKYEGEIGKYLNDEKLITQKKIFFSSLNEEEKNYLKNIKKIDIGLETNSFESRYSEKEKKYVGPIPDILNSIQKIMNVKFNYVGKPSIKWQNLQDMFFENKLQVLPVSVSNKNFSKYIFSEKLYDVQTYLILKKDVTNDKVGVEKDTVYETVAKDYFFPENIVKYSTSTDVEKALEKKEVRGILAAKLDKFDDVNYVVEEIESIPVNLAFQKDEEILRNIFNKAIKTLGKKDIKEINLSNQLAEKKLFQKEVKETEILYKIIAIIVVIVAFLLLIIIYEILTSKKMAKKLRIDLLTNLYNRVKFNEFCHQKKDEKGVAILIDLNNFKQVNDKFSHKLGDDVLVEIGKIISKVFKDDYNFRISGDEFYSFLKEKGYKQKLEELEKESRASELLKKYDISYSLGYFLKTEKESIETAFKYAGLAMQRAKKEEPFAIVEASEELLKEKERKLKIKELLKESIETEFYPVYQPKVDTETLKIKGAEALCRWKNKELGMIFPGEFIPLSEELKLVYLIDYQIAKEAMKSVKKWIEEGRVSKDFRISFNLSMQTFDRDDVVEKIKEMIKEVQIEGKNVEIEITESVISNNISVALAKLNKLKKLGITIALDDFTAGHSTASLLPVLPIDVIKYDKSLLDLYNRDGEKGKIIYRTLIKMAKDLEMETVSEGVETKEEYLFLKSKGIDTLQGYYFGKPEVEEIFLKSEYM